MRRSIPLLLLAAGCAKQSVAPETGAPSTPPQTAAPAGASASPAAEEPPASDRRHATLHFREIEGKRFPFPLLRGTVRGSPTWFIADTGATHHVLGSSLARKLRVDGQPSGIEGRGHLGERVLVQLAKDPALVIEEWGALSGEGVLIADLPALFENLDLGGVISPQALTEATGLAVFVDFREARLELIPEANALASLVGGGYWLGRCKDCVCSGTRNARAPAYVLSARVGGHVARLGIDSGAEHTDVRLGSEPGKKLAPRATAGQKTQTAGTQYVERTAAAVAVTVGDVSRQLDIALVPGNADPDCPSDGNLGMDVLASCSLVLTPHSFAARCQ